MEENNPVLLSDDTEAFNKLFNRVKRIKELDKKNNYDKDIEKFYYEGYFVIDNNKIDINHINILKVDKGTKEEYMLDIVDSKEPLPEDIKILEIIRLKDTSIFELLIKRYKDKIVDNVLVFDEEMKKYLYSLEWDGKLHILVPETHERVLSQENI